MKRGNILHVLNPDKFTIPFIKLINSDFDNNHHFLFCSKPNDEILLSADNITYLRNPYRKNFIRNTIIFYNRTRKSSKIILHGDRLNLYFFLFSRILRKTFWIIQGYEFTDTSVEEENKGFESLLKRFVLKRVYGHISHIEGDSKYANLFFKSNARFFFSPGYLSNIVEKHTFLPNTVSKPYSASKRILVGNSTSPTNHHSEIFEMLYPFRDENIEIYCPLSYGIYESYRDSITRKGSEMFGEKFIPIIHFMKLNDYLNFLKSIDIAIFNHKRQEAMGVTIQLLSHGKIVYMKKDTTAFREFERMGIRVFDNSLIKEEGLFKERDVSVNKDLVYSYYSYERLISSWTEIFEHRFR